MINYPSASVQRAKRAVFGRKNTGGFLFPSGCLFVVVLVFFAAGFLPLPDIIPQCVFYIPLHVFGLF